MNYLTYSIFHHDIDFINDSFNSNAQEIFQLTKNHKPYSIKDIGDIIFKIVTSRIGNYSDKDISITLTGGLDSRLILACLLKAGVKPNCFIYGNSKSRDVTCAKSIAEGFNLKLHNYELNNPNKDWYYKWVLETIKRDNGNAHLHRAHRTAAIAEHFELFHPKILFTGHMGGEGIRGLTYNNYFASEFFELVNENRIELNHGITKTLSDYFIIADNVNIYELTDKIKNLSWMKHGKELNKFYFLYDLVAPLHHFQDIRIFKTYIKDVIPVFLQKEYLEVLFSSKFHFLNASSGVLGKLKYPNIYSTILEYLYPKLLHYPLSNFYKPKEYLNGLWYYIPVKLCRKTINASKYPSTFSYESWFLDFIYEYSRNIDDHIWEIYDKAKYFHGLNKTNHNHTEGYWHKFSNPIFFDLLNKYKKGTLKS